MISLKLGKAARCIVPALACVFALTSFVHADEAADGRTIAAKAGDAVVKIQLVVKLGYSYEGRSAEKSEQKVEATGTFIDSSGLLVTSLSQTNPGDLIASLMGESSDMNISSEVTDLKIRLADGREIPAKIVLRDKDLDLVFIRPSQKLASPVSYVDLKDGAGVDLLDQVVVLNRMGKAANRSLATLLDRVQAVVEKPRKAYSISLPGGDVDLGAPAFTTDGKVIGILLLRLTPMSPSEVRSRSASEHVMPVIVPAQDIAAIAAQAPENAPKEAVKPAKPVVKPVVKKPAAKPVRK